MAAVSVVEDADGVARLRINNRQQEGSSATRGSMVGRPGCRCCFTRRRGARLFLGLGTGVTASSAAEDPTLDVDAVELLPEVIAASSRFSTASDADGATRRLHVLGRGCAPLRARQRSPLRRDRLGQLPSGAQRLGRAVHGRALPGRARAARRRRTVLPVAAAAPAGSSATLRSIVRSFVSVYPRRLGHPRQQQPGDAGARSGRARRPGPLRRRRAARRLSHAGTARASLPALGFEDEFSVLGSVVAGPTRARALRGECRRPTPTIIRS